MSDRRYATWSTAPVWASICTSQLLAAVTFNIQHGIDGSHKYNLQRSIDVIARVQPDLVALQEVTRNHPYYNCDDQPAKLASGVTAVFFPAASEAVIYVMMAIILLARPRGLFGEEGMMT